MLRALGSLKYIERTYCAVESPSLAKSTIRFDALTNSPLHPNYPNSDLLEANHNQSQQKAPLSVLTREVGESAVFSGAMLLHLGVSDPRADFQNLQRVINLFMKTVDAEEVQKKFDPIEDRLNKS